MDTKETKDEKEKKNVAVAAALKKKGILLIATTALLISVLVMGATAWYTRVSNVQGITMDVAKFNFNANYKNYDFVVDASDYSDKVSQYKIAPGGGGIIPIMVSAEGSDVAINYEIMLTMVETAPEFRERLHFYYYKADDPTTKVTINGIIEDNVSEEVAAESKITGWLSQQDTNHSNNQWEKTEYIYWEWIYTLSKDCYYVNGKWKTTTNDAEFKADIVAEYTRLHPGETKSAADIIREHDNFDTEIALGHFDNVFTNAAIKDQSGQPVVMTKTTKEYYVHHEGQSTQPVTKDITAVQQAMQVKFLISGAQGTPGDVSPITNQGTTTKPAIATP